MPTIAELAAEALAADQAAAAELAEQWRDGLIEVARTTIGQRLAPLDPADLDVVHVDMDADLVVLTDGEVCLAVYDGGGLYLAADDDGWTRKAGPVTSLAHLGELLQGADA